MHHKPIADQVLVITGASSGIGLVTAKAAARRGARVVLAARGEEGLQRAVEEIRAEGGEAMSVTADVAIADDLVRVAQLAVERYGGFDSWVNDAGVGIYGELDEVSLEDKRRLFDVNFWGVVHGCRAALPHLKEHGGTIVNIGSVTADRALPLLGIYSASKQAVKAYTDTLRMECEQGAFPVSIALVTPSSIDTPFFEHARNYMEKAPKPMAPVYAPEVVADAILACCERGVRDVTVGGGGRMLGVMGRWAPRLADRFLQVTAFDGQQYADKPPVGTHSLYEPMPGGERGRYDGRVMESSAYTKAALTPVPTMVLLAGLAGLGYAASRLFGRGRETPGDRDMRQAVPVPDDVESLTLHTERAMAASARESRRPREAEVPRAVALSADSAEGSAHVPVAGTPDASPPRPGAADDRTDRRGAPVYRWGSGPSAR